MSDLGSPVVEGRLRYLSPSSMTLFDPASYGGCERRWHYRYVVRRKEPEKKATKLGTQCHAQLAHYFSTGEDVLGDVVRAGARFLPSPGPDLRVERGFANLVWRTHQDPTRTYAQFLNGETGEACSPLLAAGVPVIGFIDLAHARGEWLDDDGVARPDPGAAEVFDAKTTKRIADEVDSDTGLVSARGYAKGGEELARTWQMVSYGEVARLAWPEVKSVRLSHGYFQTHGPRAASKRSALVPVELNEERWAAAGPLVRRMVDVARETDSARVDANYDACQAYGGCPHRAECPRDPRRVLAEVFGGGKAMGILDKLRKGGASAPAAAADTIRVTREMLDEEKRKLEAEEREARAVRAGASITPPDQPAPEKIAEPHPEGSVYAQPLAPCLACGATLSAENTSRLPSGVVKHVGCPGAPLPAAAPAGGACPSGGQQRELSVDEVANRKVACACGASLKVKPAKLGDGKYYALVPKHDLPGAKAEPQKTEAPKAELPKVEPPPKAEPPKEQAPKAEAPKEQSPKVEPPKEQAVDQALDLYLDCGEDGVHASRLETYAEQLCRALEAEYKAADVRCAPESSPLAFGKWKGALAALARAQPPAPGAYTCSKGDEVGYVVFLALVPLARRVVRG